MSYWNTLSSPVFVLPGNPFTPSKWFRLLLEQRRTVLTYNISTSETGVKKGEGRFQNLRSFVENFTT